MKPDHALNDLLHVAKGKWYRLETQWKNLLNEGKRVEANIKPIYSGSSKRPDSFRISYAVDGRVYLKNLLKIRQQEIKNERTRNLPENWGVIVVNNA